MSTGNKRYEMISFLGEGQFATVYKSRDIFYQPKSDTDFCEGDDIVAVKKIKLGQRSEAKEGVNRTALREIKLLQEVSHPNIICLRDVFGHISDISLVMDFMTTDLEVIIKDSTLVLTTANIKSYLIQTLLGLEYLHDNWILHRDLKPNNLLVNTKGVVKLTDFGLARTFGSPNKCYTHLVVTRWYRAPELLFGCRSYGTGIDIWAVGCILGELLLRIPLLAGETDLDQLGKIFQAFGTPTQLTWPDHHLLPDFVKFKTYPATPLTDIFTAASPDLIHVLDQHLQLDPNKRCSASQALHMPLFSNKPYPTNPVNLPLPAQFLPPQSTGGDSTNFQKNGGGGIGTVGFKRKLRHDAIVSSGLAKRIEF